MQTTCSSAIFRKKIIFLWIKVIKMSFFCSNCQWCSIGCENGLVPRRRQAIDILRCWPMSMTTYDPPLLIFRFIQKLKWHPTCRQKNNLLYNDRSLEIVIFRKLLLAYSLTDHNSPWTHGRCIPYCELTWFPNDNYVGDYDITRVPGLSTPVP